MAEALSQSQIDALLSGISLEDVKKPETSLGGRKIKEYDFRSPKKFTKEQLRTLNSLHDNIARYLSSYFTGILRIYCEVAVIQIEEQRYYEYNNALADNVLIGMVELSPADKNLDESTFMVDLSTSIGFFMIDRLLGGSGEGYNINRDFTEIEVAILTNILNKITSLVQEAWCTHIPVEAKLRSVETNSRLIQAFLPDDTVVIALLSIQIKNLTGTLSVCIPAISLEEMIENFSTKYMRLEKRRDFDKEEYRKKVIMNSIQNAELDMKVVLDNIEIDLYDILGLKIDDVIPLSKNIHASASVLVEDTPWFEAKIGQVKQKKAIKINNVMIQK